MLCNKHFMYFKDPSNAKYGLTMYVSILSRILVYLNNFWSIDKAKRTLQ